MRYAVLTLGCRHAKHAFSTHPDISYTRSLWSPPSFYTCVHQLRLFKKTLIFVAVIKYTDKRATQLRRLTVNSRLRLPLRRVNEGTKLLVSDMPVTVESTGGMDTGRPAVFPAHAPRPTPGWALSHSERAGLPQSPSKTISPPKNPLYIILIRTSQVVLLCVD